MESDASEQAIGAILSQKGQPNFNEALKGKAFNLSTYEKEMLATIKAVQKWCQYLLGRPFIVRTNQRSLKYLAPPPNCSLKTH